MTVIAEAAADCSCPEGRALSRRRLLEGLGVAATPLGRALADTAQARPARGGPGQGGAGWMQEQAFTLASALAAFATDLGPLMKRVTVVTLAGTTDYRDVLGELLVRRTGLPQSALAQAFPGHKPSFLGLTRAR